jgi:hypothetical protein
MLPSPVNLYTSPLAAPWLLGGPGSQKRWRKAPGPKNPSFLLDPPAKGRGSSNSPVSGGQVEQAWPDHRDPRQPGHQSWSEGCEGLL